MTLRTLARLCAVVLVSLGSTAWAGPSVKLDGPLAVMKQASKHVRLVSQGPCISGRNFYRFTDGPARRVLYRHAYGTSEAVITCRDNKRRWIKIYPRGNKRVRFMSHGATILVAQIKRAGQWTKVCEGRWCRGFPELAASDIERWRRVDYRALRRLGRRFRNSHKVPRRYQHRVAGKPLFRRGHAPLPIVFFEPHKRYRVIWPDGSAPRRLGIKAAFRYGSIMRGSAVDKPLVSPDGRWLADLVPRGLRLTVLRSGTSHVHSFHGRHVLIGPWAPDSTGLLLWLGRNPVVFDVRRGTTTPVNSRVAWGFTGHSLITAQRSGADSSTIVSTDLAGKSRRVLGTVRRDRVFMLRPRAGAVVMRSLNNMTPELHLVFPNGRWRPLVTSHLAAGSFRLSPNGRKVTAVLYDPKNHKRTYLTVIDTRSNKRSRLTRCSTLCNYYWYTNNTLVIETHREISLLRLDGREQIVQRDAHLVRMGAHR